MLEELLREPFWVVDFLPEQVPADGGGQFFAVERFFLEADRGAALRRRFGELLLKVNCYFDCLAGPPEEGRLRLNPPPGQLFAWVAEEREDLCILLPGEKALITLNRGDTHLTVYHPSGRLLGLMKRLAAGAGLYMWQPES